MVAVKLTIQYDGTGFFGLELQPGKRTVRSELAKAFKALYKQPVTYINASRTDAGVHALGQVISYEPPLAIPIGRLPEALNSFLPADIRVIGARVVGRKFHARYDAKAKEYEYLIYNGRIIPPHWRHLAWQVRGELDLTAMRRAAKYLVGRHDFSSFCAAGSDDKDKVRIIHSFVIRNSSFVIWAGQRVPVISVRVRGNGFLYKMVRNLVGTLVEVGLGQREPEDVKAILVARDRKKAGKTAPAHGLCLHRVCYN
ncbi:MAG: tRNA pseudouridine(38-40) synthase TruA [Candidatus Margulisbacteria bacterium]|jgi:tRNA pseudouridine38-40 synthase|nr:tRNA pseudouridine(38-40) synthase TruA [Candidatus Margulisiibacteriota bacterium]